MIKETPPAIVLGLGVNGLGIVRSLGVMGVNVHGICDEENYRNPGRFSKYCNAAILPDVKVQEDKFLQMLIDKFGNGEIKPVLFSESDLYTMFLSKHRNELQRYFRFILPENDLLFKLTSKDHSSPYVSSKGLQIPDTYFIDNESNADEVLNNVGYPCLMKPINSYSVNLGKKTITFENRASLKDFLKKRNDVLDKVIIQEIVPGGDANTYQATSFVSGHGELYPIFTMRKIRQHPPNFGITSYGISEDVPELREIVRKFIGSINYRGFYSIEFKLHPVTKNWLYIELNPRLPYYNALIYDSGINFPLIYYRDMLDMKSDITSIRSQRNGVRWIDFVGDLYTFTQKHSQHQINLLTWLVSVSKTNSYSIFNRKDLRPFFYRIIYLIRRFLQKTFLKDRFVCHPHIK